MLLYTSSGGIWKRVKKENIIQEAGWEEDTESWTWSLDTKYIYIL